MQLLSPEAWGTTSETDYGLDTTRDGALVSRFESTPGIARFFCRKCGCQVLCLSDQKKFEDLVWFLPATLDDGGARQMDKPRGE